MESLHFQDSLKDLKNLRKQFYSAVEYFESSVIESSKDYVAKALVSTGDHLGSVADKFNSFLDEKTSEFSATSISFSCIQQRLNTFREFVDLRGISQHSMMAEAPKYPVHEQYIVPSAETFHIGRSKSMHRNLISSPQYDAHKPKQGKRSVSPLCFSLKRSGSVANRSMSPSPSHCDHGSPLVPLGSTSNPETTNSERETEPYTKRRKHLFKVQSLAGRASVKKIKIVRRRMIKQK